MRRAAPWAAIVLGYLWAASDGPIPAMLYVLCVGVAYLLVVIPRWIVGRSDARRLTSEEPSDRDNLWLPWPSRALA